jgi:hypothetical protein
VDRPDVSKRERFSLAHGGPYRALMHTARLVRDDRGDLGRLILTLVALIWVPIVAFAGLEHIATHRWDALVRSPAVHVRLLATVPLLLFAEEVMHTLSERSVDQFIQSDLVTHGPPQVHRVLERATRLRDARLPEIALAFAAIAEGQAALWDFRRTSVSAPTWAGAAPLAWVWWGCVSLPIAQFLLYRSIWRWIIWAEVLWGFSRLALQPVALHPDRCGGLRSLGQPTVGFAIVVMGVDCLVAGTWGAHVLFEHAPLESCAAPFTVATAVGLLVGLGPLCVFSRCMWRARFVAVRQYDLFALTYARLFHRKWIDTGDTHDLLGSADIQSMADLANTLTIVRSMRLVPFGLREVAALIAAVWLPAAPLILATVPLNELLKRIAGALLVVLPW